MPKSPSGTEEWRGGGPLPGMSHPGAATGLPPLVPTEGIGPPLLPDEDDAMEPSGPEPDQGTERGQD